MTESNPATYTIQPILASLPTPITASAIFLALYICALGWIIFKVKRGGDNISTIPWLIFILVRIIQFIIGISCGIRDNRELSDGRDTIVLTLVHSYLYDVGFFFITLGLCYAVAIVLAMSDRRPWMLYRNSVGAAIFAILTAVYVYCSRATVDAVEKGDLHRMKIDRIIGRVLLCTIHTVLQLIILGVLAPLVYLIFLSNRRKNEALSSADVGTITAICFTTVLLCIRSISEGERSWKQETPSRTMYIGAGLIPESIILIAWLVCATLISRWDMRRWQEVEATRYRAAQLWKRNIDEAYKIALCAEDPNRNREFETTYKLSAPSWVVLFAEQHFRKILRQTETTDDDHEAEAASIRSGLPSTYAYGLRKVRAEESRSYLNEVASLIANCITLLPCWRDSLLHPSRRPLSHEMTEKKVVHALRGRFGKTQSRAELMSEDLTFVFLSSLAPDGMGASKPELYMEVEAALANARIENLTLITKLAILSAVQKNDGSISSRLGKISNSSSTVTLVNGSKVDLLLPPKRSISASIPTSPTGEEMMFKQISGAV